jgi:hypothetical protein
MQRDHVLSHGPLSRCDTGPALLSAPVHARSMLPSYYGRCSGSRLCRLPCLQDLPVRHQGLPLRLLRMPMPLHPRVLCFHSSCGRTV